MTPDGSRDDASGLGRVFFVGAGPGAADLLTVRAIRTLARADVVLHDALMTDEVLDWAPGAELIPVGKRCDGASAEQGWIDRALVDAARRHAVVVRLKGGDPTVFGRLDEEIDALDAAGVRWEIVPGITAASAAAAQAGHSLTRRGVARRVDVVTPRVGRGEPGHGDGRDDGHDGARDGDWAAGLSPSGTAVLYMAGRIAGRCARTLLARGFPDGTPVVAVRAASWPDAATERTTLAALAAGGLAVDARPVVLLVGQAVGSRPAAEAERRRLAASAAGHAAVAVDAPMAVPVA